MARQTASSISVADPDGGRNIRLKGALYEQNFSVGESPEREYRNAKDHYQQQRSAEYERNRRYLEERISRKAEYNQKRYQREQRGVTHGIQEVRHAQDMAMSLTSDPVSVSRSVHDMGLRGLSEPQRLSGTKSGMGQDSPESGHNHLHSGRQESEALRKSGHNPNHKMGRLHGDKGVLDDRVRKNAVERIREIRQRSSDNRASVENRVKQLNQASDGFKSAVNQRGEKNRGFNSAVSGVPDRLQTLNQSINRKANQQRMQVKRSSGMSMR